MIDKVMAQNNGVFPGTEKFVEQLSSLEIDAVRGPVRIDHRRNPVHNIYIKKVERRKMFGYPDAELWNTVIEVIPDVGQFGQFDEEEFLSSPVYSRDYPPCKYCE